MQKKRILIFSTAYLPHIGGAEVAVKEITDRIPEYEFVMITARLDKKNPIEEKIGNITVHRIGMGNGFDKFRLFFSGVKKAKTLGSFDIVWSIMASYAGFAGLRYKKKNSHVPFLLTLQEGDSKWHIYKHVWWCWPYFKQIFRRADRIQAISSYLEKWARRLGATCPIEIVPNGVEIKIQDSELNPADIAKAKETGGKEIYSIRLSEKCVEQIEAINSKDNLNEGDVLILSISRLVKKNGLRYLISAMKFLPSNYKLRIVGEGNLLNKLSRLVHHLNLSDRVFFHGHVEYNQVWKNYYRSDLSYLHYPSIWKLHQWGMKVFVRHSLSEGLGNVFLEAMHLQTPVIATNVGGIPDFLRDGETGWFAKVKDPEDLAKKILYVTNEKNKKEIWRVIENARQMIAEKYSWDVVVNQMKIIFNGLTNSSSP